MTCKKIGFHRSQAQLQKLGEDLDVGGGNEDHSKIKDLDDDVNGGFDSPLNEGHLNSSPRRKRSRVSLEAQDASYQGNLRSRVRFSNIIYIHVLV